MRLGSLKAQRQQWQAMALKQQSDIESVMKPAWSSFRVRVVADKVVPRCRNVRVLESPEVNTSPQHNIDASEYIVFLHNDTSNPQFLLYLLLWSEMTIRAVICLPDYGFDPTEAAVPYTYLSDRGVEFHVATQNGACSFIYHSYDYLTVDIQLSTRPATRL